MKMDKKDHLTQVHLAEGNIVQRNGEAASQIGQAYIGRRFDSKGNEIIYHGRNLKQISEYKVNPEYHDQNIKQQSGFSAELINEARKNEEAIKSGSDFRVRTTDGVGRTNDTQYDLISITQDGKEIPSESVQMKFLGVTKDGKYNVIERIVKDSSWDRYDTVIEIPSDQYDGAVKYALDQAEKLKVQAEKLNELGKTEQALKINEQAQKYENSVKRIRKSKLTAQEAIEARVDPLKFTVKETARSCINGGIEMMSASALVAGAVSIAGNTISVFKGDKDPEIAAAAVAKDIVTAGASGFVVGTASTGIKAAMHTAGNEVIRKIGTTNAPIMIVTGVIDISKSLKRFACGEIDTLELFNELGQKGVCAVSSSVGLSIGTVGGAIISKMGAAIGGVVGGMAGYAVAAALYDSVVNVLKEEKISSDRRKYLDELSAETQRQMSEYREMIRIQGDIRLKEYQFCFDRFFNDIDQAIISKDPDDSISAFCRLNSDLGIKSEFNSFKELDDFMSDDKSVLVL